jgi:hypothetical protein
MERRRDHVQTVIDSAQRQHADECAQDIGLAALDGRLDGHAHDRVSLVGWPGVGGCSPSGTLLR